MGAGDVIIPTRSSTDAHCHRFFADVEVRKDGHQVVGARKTMPAGSAPLLSGYAMPNFSSTSDNTLSRMRKPSRRSSSVLIKGGAKHRRL